MITRDRIRLVVYKHLPGQHPQARHGWRYDRLGRRPLYTEVEESAIYEERRVTRHGLSEQDVLEAKRVIAVQQGVYLNKIREHNAARHQIAIANSKYKEAGAVVSALFDQWKRIGKPLEEKQEKIRDAETKVKEKKDELVLAGKGNTEQYRKLDARERKLNRQYWEIHEKLWSGKYKKLQEDQSKAREDEQRAQIALMNIIGGNRAMIDGMESAITGYVASTASARSTLLLYYRGEAEKVRRAAMVENKRNIRWANYYSNKASKATDDYHRKSEEWQKQNNRWEGYDKTPEGKRSWDERNRYWELSNQYKMRAQNVFAKKLEQSNRTEMDRIPMERIKDDDTRSAVSSGIDGFSRLVGSNPFIKNEPLLFVTNSGEYFRAGYLNNVITIQNIPNLRKSKSITGRVTESDRRMVSSSIPRSVVHEMGHWLENYDPGIRASAISFWKRRTAGEKPSALFGELKFGAFDFTEYSLKDKFVEPYTGKTYGTDGVNFGTKSFATEIMSTGIEMFFKDPIKLAEDPDMFGFIYAVLRMNP